MIPELQSALNPDYEALPRFIKDQYSVKEWLWLSDSEKVRLIQNETEPDTYND